LGRFTELLEHGAGIVAATDGHAGVQSGIACQDDLT